MDLGRLRVATSFRLKKLHHCYDDLSKLTARQQSIMLAFIVIELDNLIVIALRAFIISTLREARTASGAKIRVEKCIGEEEEIAAYVLSILNIARFNKLKHPSRISRRDEPTIRDPKEVEKVLSDCNASNIVSLQTALSINSRIFRDIKFIRHFYAHRGADTFKRAAASARAMGILTIRHPDEILLYVIRGRPYSVLKEWLMDAELFFELMLE